MMRNRWGVEIKKGYVVSYRGGRNGDQPGEGVVLRSDSRSAFAKAYGTQITVDENGYEHSIGADSIVQALPPSRGKNPLSRVKVNSPSMATGEAPSKRLKKRRSKRQRAPAGVYANPLVRVKVGSPSMATGEAPTKRLRKRRKNTQAAPEGFYANPNAGFLYCVWRLDANGEPAYFMRAERTLKAAKEYAQSLADKGSRQFGIIKKPL